MLRHVRANQTYWFCRHCWQEMPNSILNGYSPSTSLVALVKLNQRPAAMVLA
ncbi:hypothetical protein ACN4EK_00910 [Pantanalinema rosaneae CENA516]|uniref:hypothetical protein n=1 Tax=Pantanalinema rosaneae TaxID=1620701 RepID=UPI003D6E69CA